MSKKFLLFFIAFLLTLNQSLAVKNPFKDMKNPFVRNNDTRAKEIKYQYNVLKNDEIKKMDKKILNRTPSGYMTVDEYEALSEYKDKSVMEFSTPGVELPSDFKYVPHPQYSIVKYNNPPGSVELSLGKRLFIKRQINAQGIVSPDFTMLVYPAVYYYADSASVACDLFVIPLREQDNNLNRILKANVAQRNAEPILSTDKVIDSYAIYRTLTPIDFSADGKKLLVKQKIGSSEDGIWQTKIFVYDFDKKLSYDLSDVREAVTYYWKEYEGLNLDDKRWDIVPLGFEVDNPDRVALLAYAYTGETPVYLGSWSIDAFGNQSRLISLNKDVVPKVSMNGLKLIKDGVETYQSVQIQEKLNKKQGHAMIKQAKEADKNTVKAIKQEFKYSIRDINEDCKEDLRDYKKLRSFSGSTEGNDIDNAYNEYLKQQWQKDINKTEKEINKKNKEIDKINQKIEKLNSEISTPETSEAKQDNEASSVPGQTEQDGDIPDFSDVQPQQDQ